MDYFAFTDVDEPCSSSSEDEMPSAGSGIQIMVSKESESDPSLEQAYLPGVNAADPTKLKVYH